MVRELNSQEDFPPEILFWDIGLLTLIRENNDCLDVLPYV